jgi:hypothetical protein
MAKQDLKKYCMHPHVLTIDNICGPLLLCVHMAVRDSQLAYNQPFRVRRHALQSEGRIILIYSYFIEFRIYFHPYYNMTLGFKSLGLVVVLFSS